MIGLENLRIDLPGFSLQDVDFTVNEGEFFALLGPTGSGKTLALEAIAGLVPISGGRILIGRCDVTGLAPEHRKVGIVYQDHALFPHLTVFENITYGLRYGRRQSQPREADLLPILEQLDISHLAQRAIHHLSGGERQRVALARALAVTPSVLLLDEPLSSLDPNFREEIRKVLKRLHEQTKITFLMVTHDFAEALFLAERAAVIHQGRIEQVGTTAEIFCRPRSPFVAQFVGMKNVFEPVFVGRRAVLGELELELEESVPLSRRYLAVRPEDILLSGDREKSGVNTYAGEVVGLSSNGLYYDVYIQLGSVVFQAMITKSTLLETGLGDHSQVSITLQPSTLHTF